MKQQIFNYQLFLFGNKGEFITLTQVQGQQITMIMKLWYFVFQNYLKM